MKTITELNVKHTHTIYTATGVDQLHRVACYRIQV